MIIGVISDIHGPLPDNARKALADVDKILCAGDVEMPQTIWELDAIAPTIAVSGNCDRYVQSALRLPYSASPKLDGVRFHMVHRPSDIGTPADDVQVVIHGHTHVPRDEMINGVRYLNPGSACYPRGGSNRSCLILDVSNGSILEARFVNLDQIP